LYALELTAHWRASVRGARAIAVGRASAS